MRSTGGDDWWRRAVIYQVYPRSFQDSNGDGIGDLQGIIERLDYLNDGTDRSLGIDAIWLSPTFPSPMKDFGYDVSDYRDVHPDFGSLQSMDRLITECHRREIRVLLDFVPNHTSDQHPWFVEARSTRSSPKRDWYVWKDPRPGGGLPNNWWGIFGGPAWEWDPTTEQYYLHSFLVEQPDLNWRNPAVVEAMHNVLRFWMDRGIDGFRIDVMHMLLKDPDFADNPLNPDWQPGDPEAWRWRWVNNVNYPDVYDAVRGIRRVLDEYPARMAVGEVFGSSLHIARYYGGEALDGLHLAFNFHFINEREPVITPWEAPVLGFIVRSAEAAMPPGAQPCYAFNNHDRPRLASRLNGDGHGQERARAAALLLLGLRGTPFVYYGEEIGMGDVAIPESRLQDPARFHSIGRDPARTPMHWDGTTKGGFTTGEPWLPCGPRDVCVQKQSVDPASLLALYRRAVWQRKQEPALHSGSYRELRAEGDIFAFLRECESARPVLVVVNTGLAPRSLSLPGGDWDVTLATTPECSGPVTGSITLPPLGAAWLAGHR